MVHGIFGCSLVKGPYRDCKKEKEQHASSSQVQRSHSQPQEQQQQEQKDKDNKYGAWGPVYKDKQNFINMHLC